MALPVGARADGTWSAALINDYNVGHASDRMQGTSGVGVAADGEWRWSAASPGDRHGRIEAGPRLAVWSIPDRVGTGYVRPGAHAAWKFFPGDLPFDELAIRTTLDYEYWSVHLRDAWVPGGGFALTKAAGPAFVSTGYAYAKRTPSSSSPSRRNVFAGRTHEVLVSAALPPTKGARYLAVVNGVWVQYAFRRGDYVSTGRATSDVVAASEADIRDPLLDPGDPYAPNGYRSYRLQATTHTLSTEIYVTRLLGFRWDHEITAGRAGFSSQSERFALFFRVESRAGSHRAGGLAGRL